MMNGLRDGLSTAKGQASSVKCIPVFVQLMLLLKKCDSIFEASINYEHVTHACLYVFLDLSRNFIWITSYMSDVIAEHFDWAPRVARFFSKNDRFVSYLIKISFFYFFYSINVQCNFATLVLIYALLALLNVVPEYSIAHKTINIRVWQED